MNSYLRTDSNRQRTNPSKVPDLGAPPPTLASASPRASRVCLGLRGGAAEKEKPDAIDGPCIGIDLGTTYRCCFHGVWSPSQSAPLPSPWSVISIWFSRAFRCSFHLFLATYANSSHRGTTVRYKFKQGVNYLVRFPQAGPSHGTGTAPMPLLGVRPRHRFSYSDTACLSRGLSSELHGCVFCGCSQPNTQVDRYGIFRCPPRV